MGSTAGPDTGGDSQGDDTPIPERSAALEDDDVYRILFQANPLPTWVFDPESLAFLDVNEAAVRTYGYTRQQFLSMTLVDIRPPEDVPALVRDVSQRRDASDINVWRHRTASGKILEVEVHAHPVRFAGRSARLVVARDVTDERRRFRQLEAETRLRRGLDAGEFRLHFQPVLDLETGRALGAEALARWDRPGHGLVGPADFIGVAEETGVIVPLGEWVLHEACEQLRRWRAQHPLLNGFHVAVNVSASQLEDPHLPEIVRAALGAAGLRPSHLCLEITESVLLDDVDAAVAALQRIRDVGVSLSIDDFGTGYSSLSYLRRLPVDTLKVDQSFVSGVDRGPEDAAIVAAVVRLAGSVGMATVAEGVERESQVRALQRLGVRMAQGFLWSPPVPAEHMDRWLP